MNNFIVFDIEANGLLYEATEIHCISVYISNIDSTRLYTSDQSYYRLSESIGDFYSDLQSWINSGYNLVGHNITGYDFLLLDKLKDKYKSTFIMSLATPKAIDTMLLSQMMYPFMPSSLDYWGNKLGKLKPVHEDWSVLSTEMIKRCQADVEINTLLYNHLATKFDKAHWADAHDLEKDISRINATQELTGIRFNIVEAYKTYKKIKTRAEYLLKDLQSKIPGVVVNLKEIKKPFLAKGGCSKAPKDYFIGSGYPIVKMIQAPNQWTAYDPEIIKIGGPFTRIKIRPVNLDSGNELKPLLLELGWKPTEWNSKIENGEYIRTSPKLTEDSYASLPPGIGQDIAEYLMLRHRERWFLNKKGGGAFSEFRKPTLSNIVVGNNIDDGTMRIPAKAISCGTNTARYRHLGKVCNMPKVSIPWGKEIRSLFVATPGYKLLGIDLSGIEARVMAHYTYPYDNGELANRIMAGDIHSSNAKVLGCDRDTAKTFLYAICYGAKTKRLTGILNCKSTEASKLIDDFWNENEGLKILNKKLEYEFMANDNEWISGLDKRKIYVNERRLLLNAIIQSASAILFKSWMRTCEKALTNQYGYNNVRQLLAYHDELLFEVPNSANMSNVKDTLLNAIVLTGTTYNIRVPLDGDAKVGSNYAEVH